VRDRRPSLAVSRCPVAFMIRFLPAFVAAFFGRAIPPLSFEMINAGSGVQPDDRIVGTMLLGFSFGLVSVGGFGRSRSLW